MSDITDQCYFGFGGPRAILLPWPGYYYREIKNALGWWHQGRWADNRNEGEREETEDKRLNRRGQENDEATEVQIYNESKHS